MCVNILHEIRPQRKAGLGLLDSRNKARVTIRPRQIEEKNPRQTQFRNDSPKSTPFSKPPGPPKEDHCQGTRRRSTSAAAASRSSSIPRPVGERAAAEGLRRLRTPPGVPNPALGHHLPSFSGPRYLNRNKSVLFAEYLQARRKCRKTPEKCQFFEKSRNRHVDVPNFQKLVDQQGFATCSARSQTIGLPPQILGPGKCGERVSEGRNFGWRAAASTLHRCAPLEILKRLVSPSKSWTNPRISKIPRL